MVKIKPEDFKDELARIERLMNRMVKQGEWSPIDVLEMATAIKYALYIQSEYARALDDARCALADISGSEDLRTASACKDRARSAYKQLLSAIGVDGE